MPESTNFKRSACLGAGGSIVPETNSQVKGSYAMVDPAGRFFDDADGTHHYNRPILEIGVGSAIREVNYNLEKFISRGGLYDLETLSVTK